MRTHMHPTVQLRLLLPLALVVSLGGCFKLSRETPPLQRYVLGNAVPAPMAAGSTTATGRGGLTIGLRRMELASYLSTPAVMTRRGASQLVVSEFHRWGEPLDEAINRVVGAHLAVAPPVQAVDVAPWPARPQHNFIVQLRVSRFEGVADSSTTDGRVHVVANWDIIRPVNGAVLVRGSTDERTGSWRVGDYAGLVTGLDGALSRVARDIAACLSRFPNDSTPPATCGGAATAGGSAPR